MVAMIVFRAHRRRCRILRRVREQKQNKQKRDFRNSHSSETIIPVRTSFFNSVGSHFGSSRASVRPLCPLPGDRLWSRRLRPRRRRPAGRLASETGREQAASEAAREQAASETGSRQGAGGFGDRQGAGGEAASEIEGPATKVDAKMVDAEQAALQAELKLVPHTVAAKKVTDKIKKVAGKKVDAKKVDAGTEAYPAAARAGHHLTEEPLSERQQAILNRAVRENLSAEKVTAKAVVVEEAASVHEEFGIPGDFTLVATVLW